MLKSGILFGEKWYILLDALHRFSSSLVATGNRGTVSENYKKEIIDYYA